MQSEKQHKIQLLTPIILVLIVVLLLSISFWNQSIQNNTPINKISLVYLILCMLALFFLYTRMYKITDPQKIEALIREQVEEERSKILSSFETNDEEETTDKKADLGFKVKDMVPKGKFKSAQSYLEKLLSNLSASIQLSLGVAYIAIKNGKQYDCSATFAFTGKNSPASFKPGENLNGEVAKSKEIMILNDIPEEYFDIASGLGNAKPKTLIIAPLINNKKCIAVIEIATFIQISSDLKKLLQQVFDLAAEKLNELQQQ